MIGTKFRTAGGLAMSLAVAVMIASPADARRGGSAGSRGSRTAIAPPVTKTAPNQAAPVQRTMTDKPAPGQANAAAARPGAANSPNKFGNMAKGLIGGLVMGGLIGMLLGNGLGALAGSGMLMALESAELLAECTGEYGVFASDLGEVYARAHARKFRNRLTASAVLRRAAFMPRLAAAAITLTGASDRFRERLARATRSGSKARERRA